MNKPARLRRAKKTRAMIAKGEIPIALTVHRSHKHIFAQVIFKGKTIVSASTLDKAIKGTLSGTKTERAKQVGQWLAKRALEAKVERVAFDRSGFKYHGRIKALADGAREEGLLF